ncbi:MAG: prepilin-type N-terminal cleavage/methylation domain-containing protein [Burkholderiales bacterium]|jgi:prepilin-type N-terminal cleavage/methylation domain-containing protein|nr:prepilin-type N-terminal cleavage/methylation domain-containing protein [Burkholderiales bacterium]
MNSNHPARSSRMFLRRLRQRGVTLLELIAALAIIAIIIIGALALVSQADASAKSGELLRGLASLRAGTIAATMGEVGFGNDNMNTALIRSRRIPDNWTRPGNTTDIIHSYGRPVTVMGLGDRFSVTFEDVPVEACIQLISQQAGTSWQSVTVAGGTAVNFPTTLIGATAACGAAGGDLVFTSLN